MEDWSSPPYVYARDFRNLWKYPLEHITRPGGGKVSCLGDQASKGASFLGLRCYIGSSCACGVEIGAVVVNLERSSLVALGMPAHVGRAVVLANPGCLACSGAQDKGGQYHEVRKAVEEVWMEVEEDLSRDEAGLRPFLPPSIASSRCASDNPLLHTRTISGKECIPAYYPLLRTYSSRGLRVYLRA